jgi:hypothetical protein
MSLNDPLQLIAETYGLLPVYALIVAWMGFSASTVRQLLTMLMIAAGVYVTMFRAFNLGANLDVFHLAKRFGVHPDAANGVAAALFVFGLGFAVYGLKRLIVRRPRAQA